MYPLRTTHGLLLEITAAQRRQIAERLGSAEKRSAPNTGLSYQAGVSLLANSTSSHSGHRQAPGSHISGWTQSCHHHDALVIAPYGAHHGQLDPLPETTPLLPGLPAIGAIWYNEMSTFAMIKSIAILTVTVVFVLS